MTTPPYTPPIPGDYVMIDDFTISDLTTPDAEAAYAATAEPTPSAITITDEGTAATTLSIAPDWGEEITIRYETNIAEVETSAVVTFAGVTAKRRQFRVRWSVLSSSDATTLKAFLQARASDAAPFNFAAADGVTYAVRCIDQSFTLTQLAPSVYSMAEAVFEEVL
jgi:hypothetical protein